MTQQIDRPPARPDPAAERVRRMVGMTAASSLALRSSGFSGLRRDGSLVNGPGPAWAALWMNVLVFLGASILPIPGPVGQLIAQGSLPLALLLALLANRSRIIRPNAVMLLYSILALAALLASLYNEFMVSSTYRATRLVIFMIVLWLLTPWWADLRMSLLRAHLKVLRIVVGSVILGAAAWGPAHGDNGRLAGVLWPIPPPQVAHYAAMLLGCTAVLWFTGVVRRRTMVWTLVFCGYALIDSHTRTALAGMLVGLLAAGASLFLGHARVRRTTAVIAVICVFAGAFLSPFLTAWVSRGQSAEDATQLTGRTKVWTQVTHLHRPLVNQIFGNGLSNKSFNGLPIDSNWIATFLDQGLFGCGVIIAFLLTVLVMALMCARDSRRAVALFIVFYCTVASFTETGLGDASPYLLDLFVAASLVAVRPRVSPQTQTTSGRMALTAP